MTPIWAKKRFILVNEELIDEVEAARGNLTSLAVPIDLPFKKSWPELNLKGFLMDAANDDADTLGLPPYEIIAQRYGQEEGIEAISKIYDKNRW